MGGESSPRVSPPPQIPSLSFSGTKPKPEFAKRTGSVFGAFAEATLHGAGGGRLSGLCPWGPRGHPQPLRVTHRAGGSNIASPPRPARTTGPGEPRAGGSLKLWGGGESEFDPTASL